MITMIDAVGVRLSSDVEEEREFVTWYHIILPLIIIKVFSFVAWFNDVIGTLDNRDCVQFVFSICNIYFMIEGFMDLQKEIKKSQHCTNNSYTSTLAEVLVTPKVLKTQNFISICSKDLLLLKKLLISN